MPSKSELKGKAKRAAGKAQQAAGKLKEAAGKVAGKKGLRKKGRVQKVKGKAVEKVGLSKLFVGFCQKRVGFTEIVLILGLALLVGPDQQQPPQGYPGQQQGFPGQQQPPGYPPQPPYKWLSLPQPMPNILRHAQTYKAQASEFHRPARIILMRDAWVAVS